LNRISGEN